jgi:hypothetical protein
MTSRENANDTNQVVIVDLSDANNVIRRPSKSPPLFDVWNEQIIALKCELGLLQKQ